MARSPLKGRTRKHGGKKKSQHAHAHARADVAYAVGYLRPPVHTQFKKGTSGNPRGRPRGRKSLKTLIRNGLMRSMVDPKTKRRITVAEALWNKQVELGLAGSGTSTFTIFKVAEQFGAFDEAEGGEAQALSAAEQEVLDRFLKKANRGDGGEQP
jgi:Family of unknown function (DUF5681)